MKHDNYHLGQLNRPVSRIDIQRNMVGFVVEGHTHIYTAYHVFEGALSWYIVHLTQQFGSCPQYNDHRNVPAQNIIKRYTFSNLKAYIDP